MIFYKFFMENMNINKVFVFIRRFSKQSEFCNKTQEVSINNFIRDELQFEPEKVVHKLYTVGSAYKKDRTHKVLSAFIAQNKKIYLVVFNVSRLSRNPLFFSEILYSQFIKNKVIVCISSNNHKKNQFDMSIEKDATELFELIIQAHQESFEKDQFIPNLNHITDFQKIIKQPSNVKLNPSFPSLKYGDLEKLSDVAVNLDYLEFSSDKEKKRGDDVISIKRKFDHISENHKILDPLFSHNQLQKKLLRNAGANNQKKVNSFSSKESVEKFKTPQKKKTFLEEDIQLPPSGFLYQTQWFQPQMFFYPQDFHLRESSQTDETPF